MKQLFRNNALFLSLSLILVAVLGLALLYIPKGELHLLLCNRHAPARDLFFRYYTHVAEWFPYVICVALLLFGRVGNGLLASACMAFTALTTQIVKHLVNAPRPITWFAANMQDVQLPLVDGVKMNAWCSFPSGHTTSFFALAFVASIIISARIFRTEGYSERSVIITYFLQFLLFVAALLGGYSRIYLSQHFALDVFGGTVVGILISIVCYAIFSRYEGQKWYNYRLLTKK